MKAKKIAKTMRVVVEARSELTDLLLKRVDELKKLKPRWFVVDLSATDRTSPRMRFKPKKSLLKYMRAFEASAGINHERICG